MAFIGLLLYVTCIYLRPGEWITSLQGSQMFDIIAGATIIFWVLSPKAKKGLVNVPQNIFILVFLLISIFSQLSRLYFGGALSAFVDFGKIVILYFFIVNLVDSVKKLKIFIGLLIILTLLLAIQGIMQYHTGYGWANQPMIEDRITWIGTFADPNVLAVTYLTMLPVSMMYVFEKYNIILKTLNFFVSGTLLWGIYCTNSRGGIIAVMAIIFLFFKNRFKNIFGLFVGTVLIISVFIFATPRMKGISAEDESAYNRIVSWADGLQMLKQSPLLGVGYRMFTEDEFYTAHNTFILCVAETGLVGLFFWLALLCSSFKGLSLVMNSNKEITKNGYLISIANAVNVSLIGHLVGIFFLSRLYHEPLYILIAFSAAIYNVTKKEIHALKSSFIAGDIIRIIAIELIVIIGIYGIVRICI